MLQKPSRSPFSFSSRLPGGFSKSSIADAKSTACKRRAAIRAKFPHFLLFPVKKDRFRLDHRQRTESCLTLIVTRKTFNGKPHTSQADLPRNCYISSLKFLSASTAYLPCTRITAVTNLFSAKPQKPARKLKSAQNSEINGRPSEASTPAGVLGTLDLYSASTGTSVSRAVRTTSATQSESAASRCAT
jgi:hypothetical protein